MKINKRLCVICCKAFETSSPTRKTCCDDCHSELCRRLARKAKPHRKTYVYICKVCQREFSIVGSAGHGRKLKTCSPECKMTCFQKAGLKEAIILQRIDVQEKRKQGHHYSPRSGPYETNTCAKEWRLIDPCGRRYKFRNLAKFVRDHFDLFTVAEQITSREYKAAQTGLSALRPEGPRKCSQWHGWTWDDSETN